MADRAAIDAQIAKIEALQDKRDNLMKSLRRSLKIQDLWPEAFKCGKVTSAFEGSVHEPGKLRFIIKRSDGETRSFSFNEVPWILLEEHVVQFPKWLLQSPKYIGRLRKWKEQK